MKQTKVLIAIEVCYLAYMAAILWMLFPGWRAPLMKVCRVGVYRWRLGRDQLHFAPLAPWIQEAAQVRGRFEPRSRAPRPLNLPM